MVCDGKGRLVTCNKKIVDTMWITMNVRQGGLGRRSRYDMIDSDHCGTYSAGISPHFIAWEDSEQFNKVKGTVLSH